jgi:hypothetical protein
VEAVMEIKKKENPYAQGLFKDDTNIPIKIISFSFKEKRNASKYNFTTIGLQ